MNQRYGIFPNVRLPQNLMITLKLIREALVLDSYMHTEFSSDSATSQLWFFMCNIKYNVILIVYYFQPLFKTCYTELKLQSIKLIQRPLTYEIRFYFNYGFLMIVLGNKNKVK